MTTPFVTRLSGNVKITCLHNPTADVLISNDLGSSLHDYKNIQKISRLPQFEKWDKGVTPSFTFGDVHMLIQKSSLAYIGLYNPEHYD